MSHEINWYTTALVLIKTWVKFSWNSVLLHNILIFKILNSATSLRMFEKYKLETKKNQILKETEENVLHKSLCHSLWFELCVLFPLSFLSFIREIFKQRSSFLLTDATCFRGSMSFISLLFHSNIIPLSVFFSAPPLVHQPVSLLQTNLWLHCSRSSILRFIGQRVQCHQHHRTKTD